MTYLALPTRALYGVRPAGQIALRPATEGDVPAIQELYRAVARAGTALMERSGPLFTASATEMLESFDGVTVAVTNDGEIVGYASWERGSGYDASGKITAHDLIGSTRAATSTLLAMFAGWASVAPTAILRLSTSDPALFEVSTSGIRVESQQPWMIRVVDAVAAIAARGWPSHLKGSIDLDLVDVECPWNEGPARLVLDGGQATLEPGGRGEVRMTARGLGVWYASAASPAVLRRAGFLSGGNAETDAFLMAATAGPAPALLDYF
jgi:predicted acetyltransferase